MKKQDLGDAVILDADANTVTSQYDDLATLPKEVVCCLLHSFVLRPSHLFGGSLKKKLGLGEGSKWLAYMLQNRISVGKTSKKEVGQWKVGRSIDWESKVKNVNNWSFGVFSKVSRLKKDLKAQQADRMKSINTFMGDGVAQAFLRALVSLIGKCVLSSYQAVCLRPELTLSVLKYNKC